MGIEELKKVIVSLVENSEDMDYILAVYSFADAYPDKSRTNHPQKNVLDSL